MARGKSFLRFLAPMVLAGAALVGGAGGALAYPSDVGGSIVLTHACLTTPTGGTCDFSFQVLDKNGKGTPCAGNVTFTASGGKGTISPTSSATDANGNVHTIFTAGSSTGMENVTATCQGNSATGATEVVGGGNGSGQLSADTGTSPLTGSGTTPLTGSGAIGLPNTSALAPTTNPMLYLALGLALMVILGGGLTLRRSRDTTV